MSKGVHLLQKTSDNSGFKIIIFIHY